MTYTPSFNVTKVWKRMLLSSVLASFVTVSMPLRATAGEAMVPELTTVQAAQAAGHDNRPTFTVPLKPEVERAEKTGYKVVRAYSHVPTSAYTSRVEECDDTPFITADGSHVRDGIVAANFLKLGTKIRIPALYGDKIFEVHDRMNARYNVRVDIWMDNLQNARTHGVRNVTIEVVEEVK